MTKDNDDLEALQDCLQEVEELRAIYGIQNPAVEMKMGLLIREASAYRTALRLIASLPGEKGAEIAQLTLNLYNS